MSSVITQAISDSKDFNSNNFIRTTLQPVINNSKSLTSETKKKALVIEEPKVQNNVKYIGLLKTPVPNKQRANRSLVSTGLKEYDVMSTELLREQSSGMRDIRTYKGYEAIPIAATKESAPVQRLDRTNVKSVEVIGVKSVLKPQATLKDIEDFNLSFAYGKYGNNNYEKDPVKTPFDQIYRPLLKGKNETTLVYQPNIRPLQPMQVGGVYGTDRFKYNRKVLDTPLINIMD